MIALGVMAVLAVASLTGFSRFAIAVVLHEGRTLLVGLDALRLLGYRQKT